MLSAPYQASTNMQLSAHWGVWWTAKGLPSDLIFPVSCRNMHQDRSLNVLHTCQLISSVQSKASRWCCSVEQALEPLVAKRSDPTRDRTSRTLQGCLPKAWWSTILFFWFFGRIYTLEYREAFTCFSMRCEDSENSEARWGQMKIPQSGVSSIAPWLPFSDISKPELSRLGSIGNWRQWQTAKKSTYNRFCRQSVFEYWLGVRQKSPCSMHVHWGHSSHTCGMCVHCNGI